MHKSDDIKELAIALCKAQLHIGSAIKASENPFLGKKYADLNAYLKVIKEPLAANGLSILQLPSFVDGVVYVETVLVHISGQWVSGRCGAPIGKHDAQGVGIVISYCRRYGLSAMLNMGAQDDDGESVKSTGDAEPKAEPKTYMRMIELIALKKVPQNMQTPWLTKAGVTSLDKLNSEQVSAIIKMLEKE